MEKCEHQNKMEHENNEEETSLKKIIIASLLFIIGLLFEKNKFLSSLLIDATNFLELSNFFKKNVISTLLFFIAYLLVGKNVIFGAIKNILKGHVFDEQFLMTVASLGAIFVGEVPEAVGVMLFYQIGEFFQDYAVDKSRNSINSLMQIRPDKATVLQNGREIEINSSEIKIGDIIIVRPGERIAVDGIIVKGKTFIDNSALTGESVPVELFEGENVFSGAINKDGVIHIQATKLAEESAASRILKLVEESSQKKAKTEKFITRFSRIYTPTVCVFALCVAILIPLVLKFAFPLIFEQYGWNVWIYRALIFLVVSCPCAIVISIPLTFFSGIGLASKNGILVKGSNSIESLCNVKTVVFDKTGTLTKGVFAVSEVHSFSLDKFTDEELIAIASHAEKYSNHPAALSLKAAHHAECCEKAIITDAQEISGEGIKVNLDGKTVLAGNERLMKNQNVRGFEKCMKNDTGTLVHIAIDGEYAGHIVISDQLKEDSKDAIRLLHKAGIKKTVMLTGDNFESAKKIAEEIKIDEFYASQLPENKVENIEKLILELENTSQKTKRGTLIFAGDGINDAPVLARADIGIAMGALGTDAAIESADVVIMSDEPSKIAYAIRISKKTLQIVKQNIIFSLAIKFAIMILGTLGITNMWIAVFGDTGVALLAVLNAMRMFAFKKSTHF